MALTSSNDYRSVRATRRAGLGAVTVVAGAAAVALSIGGAGDARAVSSNFELRVGLPNFGNNGTALDGAVDNRFQGGGGQVLTSTKLGFPAGESLRFGAALVSTDVDGDGRTDLIVGAPGWGSGRFRVQGKVFVSFGTATGITSAGGLTLPDVAAKGDEFGASLAVTTRTGSEVRDLWVGAPRRDIDGKLDAGAIYRYAISSTGVISFVEEITQDRPELPGSSTAGNRFGEVLTAAWNGVVVGVPRFDLGARKNVGAIVRLRIDRTSGALITSALWTQDSPGVPNKAETGDRFGAAVGWNGYAVGAPGEDLGAARNAGLVQVFKRSTTVDDALLPQETITQNSPKVPDRAETGDRFGSAITVGTFTCQERTTAAIGAPGEDLRRPHRAGMAKNAGSVTLVSLFDEESTCAPTVISQGHGLPGVAETGDELGTALGRLAANPELEEDAIDMLAMGSPGEDVKGVTDAGRVTTVLGTANPNSATRYGFQGGNVKDLRYGSVFAQ